MNELATLLDAQSPSGLDDLGGRWDQAVMASCRHFSLLGDAEKTKVRREINHDRSWRLVGWAEGMATLGVRERSRDVLSLGLIGLSLFDRDALDARDAEVVLALLTRACVLIGADPAEVARFASDHSDRSGRAWLLAHLPDQHVDVPPSHYETGEGETFAFCRAEPNLNPEVELADFLDDR